MFAVCLRMTILYFVGLLARQRNIKQILDHYDTVSGQLVNYQKSCIQFSNGVSNTDKKAISQILHISVSNKIDKYLGCTGIDKQRRTPEDFNSIKIRLVQKLAGWKARSLSTAGKVVIIKSNLQVFPDTV